MMRDEEVIAINLNLNTKTTESIWNDTKILYGSALDSYSIAHHSSHGDERADLNHIRKEFMLSTAKSLHTLNTEKIRGNARNPCSHTVEHVA